MNDATKAKIFELYTEDELSEHAARELLGDADFETARVTLRGTKRMLSGDTSRFLESTDAE